MRIYDVNLTGSSAAEAARAQEAQRTDRSSSNRSIGTNSGAGDSIEFSSSLGRLSQTMASYASSRSSRVEALAAQFQSGVYRPDSAATSKGMVSEALAAGVE
jgi:anti-sigma28 factor (negative regulator of flagellin synthesis)